MTTGLDVVHLRTFMAIYRASSLTQAARDLGVSQPAVSQRLQALEAAAGEVLFERNRRGVTPTTRADALATEMHVAVDVLERVLSRLAATRSTDDGPRRRRSQQSSEAH